MTVGSLSTVWRGRVARLAVAFSVLVVLGSAWADAAAARRRRASTRTAEAQPKEAPADKGVRRYDPALFGPELPLKQIVARLDLPTVDGRLQNARVVVLKHERRLELFAGDQFVKAYRIQLGPHPVGDKVKVRDGRTPEGQYTICSHQRGKYHRAMLLTYPNGKDAQRGLDEGTITAEEAEKIRAAAAAGECPPQNTRLGGWLMIHGQAPSLTAWLARAQRKGQLSIERGHEPGDGNPESLDQVWDWTQGCVALLNPDVRELSDALADGTPVEIRAGGVPTRPSALPRAPVRPATPAASLPAPLAAPLMTPPDMPPILP